MNEQLRRYERKLAFETDSWDVKTALESGENIVVIDARSPEVYQREHIPGGNQYSPPENGRGNNKTPR